VSAVDVGALVDAPDRRRRMALPSKIVFGLLAAVVLIALFGGVLAPQSETSGDVTQRLLGLGAKGHLLGTDGQGRDLFSRLLFGARLSLFTGLVPVLIAGSIGSSIGIAAGMASRRVNAAIMRTLDVFYSFPSILLAIGIAAALGPSIKNAIVALSVVLIPPVARVAEAEVLQLRNADFMKAARCSGAGRLSIAYRHVLPNVGPALLVYCTTLIGLSIVEAAGLSFLGLGAVPPKAEWGLMLNEGRTYFFESPTVALTPALAIFAVALLFNTVGERLRVELDVREQGVH
jgi:peptide/nickel transport system permease protein